MLVTTHYLDEAERCHRVALIHAGRLAALGSVPEVKSIFAERSIIEVRSAEPVETMAALDTMPDVEKTSLFGTAVHAVLASPAVTAADLGSRLRAGGIRVESIAAVAPSLEDVFLDVVERN